MGNHWDHTTGHAGRTCAQVSEIKVVPFFIWLSMRQYRVTSAGSLLKALDVALGSIDMG